MWLISMERIKNSTGQPQFNILASVMVIILILFHSSIGCERIFSFVIKTETVFCHGTSTKTLNSLTAQSIPQYQRDNMFSAETFQYFPGLKAKGA